MRYHFLKCQRSYYQAVKSGAKTFEIRKNDRTFQVGDKVCLSCYEGERLISAEGELTLTISYVFQGGEHGLHPEYCVLGFPFPEWNKDAYSDNLS